MLILIRKISSKIIINVATTAFITTNTVTIVIVVIIFIIFIIIITGELGYDGPLNDRFLHMTDDMLGPSLMHNKYSSYVYDGFCV